MKTFKGILYGIAIAIAVSAGAATVYNYFPPPGMTYSPTTGFVVGSATGGAQGAGTVNAQGVFVNGAAVVTGSGLPVGANPTGTVGLTTVNGSATTFLRSDAAPPLSQAIAPTWTGTHTFNNTTANIVLNNAGGAADTKNYLFRTSTSGILIQSATDAAPTTAVSSVFVAARSGTAWTAVNLGNATDNPTFSFLGTGQVSIAGGTVVGSPTGGNQGAGTINMQGCFVNGVACSTGGAAGANPTGTVGLSAVNGVAGTYMRSDAAPPLSQAISPTWTGNHTFTAASGTPVTLTAQGGTSALNVNVSSGTRGLVQFQNAGTRKAFFSLETGAGGFCTGSSVNDFCIASSANTIRFSGDDGSTSPVLINTSGLQANFIGVGVVPPAGTTRIQVSNGGSGDVEVLASTSTAGNSQFRATNFGGTNWSFGNLRSSNAFEICNAGTLSAGCALEIPTSGSLPKFSSAGQVALQIKTTTAAQLAEVEILGASTAVAGICTSDTSATCGTGQGAADTDIFGTGTFHLGPTTGNVASDYMSLSSSGVGVGTNAPNGAGTINASGFYQALNPIYREVSWAGTCTAGGCTTGIAKGVSAAATRNSAGNYTVTFTSAVSGNAGCTASTWSTLNNGAISTNVSTANSTTVNVVVLNSSGTAVDSGFTVVCIG